MPRPAFAPQVGNVKTLSFGMLGGAALTAFTASTQKLRMPEAGQIIGVTLNVGQRGGTHATSTFQVQNGATSLLVSAFDVAALTPGTPVDKEGAALSAAAAAVPKDAELRFVAAVTGGTSPTWADVTVQVDYVPI